MERLHYISQGNSSFSQLEAIQRALEAGCKWVQLRFKQAPEEELVTLAKKAMLLCGGYKARLIINDHVNVALEAGAHGVHLGLQDVPVAHARALLGKEKIIGGTANTLADLKRRKDEGCDYIGLGPYRFTSTKKNLSPILGIEGYKQLLSGLNRNPPIIAIGGIGIQDITPLLEIGVYGVAISGAISHHPDPKSIIQQIHEKFQRHLENSR